MKGVRQPISPAGFSLVELLIAIMILGVGLTMIAGAFPVGLSAYSRSVDETTAGLLARSVLASLQAHRTAQYEDVDYSWTVRADRYAELAVVECFHDDVDELTWLFDGGLHRAAAGSPGQVLADNGLGGSIDQWLPEIERTSGADDRFGCQVLYKRMDNPLGDGVAATFEVFLVVQKDPVAEGAGRSWHDRFPRPSGPVSVTYDNGRVVWPPGTGFAVAAGAMVAECAADGRWARVLEVDGDRLVLDRPLSAGRLVLINHVAAMYRGVVTKESGR